MEERQPDPARDHRANEAGLPKPVRSKWRWLKSSPAILLASGVAVVLVGSMTQPTLGATRSRKLKWQERRARIDREIGGEAAANQECDGVNDG